MTDNRQNTDKPPADEQKIADLLRAAGRRPDVDAERQARVYARTLEAWEAASAKPAAARIYAEALRTWTRRTFWARHRLWLVPAGIAASAALVFAIIVQPVAPPTLPVATIDKVIRSAPGNGSLAPGSAIYPGEILTTGPGEMISLALAGGTSLRVDSNTRLRLEDRTILGLESGRIYADTGEFIYRDGSLTIETTMGSITDIGTQFAVALSDESLDIAVREGRVDLDRTAARHVAIAGERLRVSANGTLAEELIAPADSFWDWTAALAPEFEIENRSLLDFLKWVARETGLELVFSANETRLSAMRTDLHGSISDFTPREALSAVLATTEFSYRIEGSQLIVER